jgi:hypothetical protein
MLMRRIAGAGWFDRNAKEEFKSMPLAVVIIASCLIIRLWLNQCLKITLAVRRLVILRLGGLGGMVIKLLSMAFCQYSSSPKMGNESITCI